MSNSEKTMILECEDSMFETSDDPVLIVPLIEILCPVICTSYPSYAEND